jgi:hypothetical protein
VGVWSQTVGFVCVFGRDLASVAMKVSSHLIYIIKKLNFVLSMHFKR